MPHHGISIVFFLYLFLQHISCHSSALPHMNFLLESNHHFLCFFLCCFITRYFVYSFLNPLIHFSSFIYFYPPLGDIAQLTLLSSSVRLTQTFMTPLNCLQCAWLSPGMSCILKAKLPQQSALMPNQAYRIRSFVSYVNVDQHTASLFNLQVQSIVLIRDAEELKNFVIDICVICVEICHH